MAVDTLVMLFLAGGLVLIGVVTVALVFLGRKREKKAMVQYQQAQEKGALPPSLHPRVKLDLCIGSGTCVEVCPESDVLAVLDGKARLVNPTSCIGHGECLRACPVDAIELVLGNERRGVDIPLVESDFQTSVPGLFIVGELGGMGLVYNAMTQAMQCLDGIKRQKLGTVEGAHQLVIVGAGPAGLAASLSAMDAGLDFVTVDQESVGGTVLQYPRHKVVMTKPVKLPLYGTLRVGELTKEQLLEKWNTIIEETGLPVVEGDAPLEGSGVRTKVKVDSVVRGDDGVFTVATTIGELRAQRVVLALGRRGTPRKMGVPGEDLGKVTYRLLEPERYEGAKVLVVGGGDSAVEAAISLGESGAATHLCYRKASFDRIKTKNQKKLDAAVDAGKVKLVLEANPKEITETHVVLEQKGERVEIENDYVIVNIGGVLPTKFLAAAGVEVKTFKGEAFAPAN